MLIQQLFLLKKKPSQTVHPLPQVPLSPAVPSRFSVPPPERVFAALKASGLVIAGILSAGMGLKAFLLASHFIDGGATGIAMLLSVALHLPLSWGLLLINLPFLILAYRHMGGHFAAKSAAAIAGLALCLAVVPYPDITPDLLLTAVFGGVFLGAGIGLAMRGGAVLDGTEILALLINRHTPLLKVSDIILLLNILIFGAAAFVLGVTEALYSILTYVSASKMLDFLLNGIEQYTGVTIVSVHSEQIRHVITTCLGRGVTVYKGQSGFGKRGEQRQEINIIFTVVTRLELPKLREEVKRLDPHAFLVQQSVDDAVGGMLKKRPLPE